MYWFTAFLGLVSIAAPYFLNYSGNVPALWTSLIFGAVLVVVSVMEGFANDKDSWEYWVVGAAGIGAILAPFFLGFDFIAEAVWTMVLVGIVTVVAAGTRLAQGGTKTVGY